MKVRDLGLTGIELRVVFRDPDGTETVFEPDLIRLGLEGMFIAWQEPPEDLDDLRIEWKDSPFFPGVWQVHCRVDLRRSDGLEVRFERSAPSAMRDWFSRTDASLSRSPADATLKTSKLYTAATVVSAGGLFCGAAAMLLPIVVGNQAWVDPLAKGLLVVMVASIGGFAWLRTLAGRAELRALRQGG